jgi:hypothetical protein
MGGVGVDVARLLETRPRLLNGSGKNLNFCRYIAINSLRRPMTAIL